jgi:hypothetical protein
VVRPDVVDLVPIASPDIIFGMQPVETMNVTTLGRTSLVVAASDGPGG